MSLEHSDADYFPRYHKIDSIFKRDKRKSLIIGDYSKPEFEVLKDAKWDCFEKIDGTNIRIRWDGVGFKIGGRTDAANLPKGLIDKINSILDVSLFTYVFGSKTVILYGEGYGNNIQAKVGHLYSAEYEFILFDIKIDDLWLGRRQQPDTVSAIASSLGISVVPKVMTGTIDDAINFCKNGFMSSIGNAPAEGLVITPCEGLKDRMGRRIIRIISKVKCCDFK